jgi:hypothetical protein
VCRNINKIDEFAAHFKKLNLTYIERIKVFDPNDIFGEHLLGVGFNTSFIHRHFTQDRDNVNNNLSSAHCNVETLQSAIELYRQHGKVSGEKSTQLPANTPKSTTPRSVTSTVHPSKKGTQKYSNGGDKKPPRINIDSSHKVPLTKKRKNNAGHAKELKIDSGKLQIEIEAEQMQKIGSSAVNISDTEFFDIDESFVIQSAIFNIQSKSMVIEKRDVTNMKGKSRTEIDFSQMTPSKIYSFH